MDYLNNFDNFNENMIGDFFTGVKTDDDRLANDMLKNLDKVENLESLGYFYTFIYKGIKFYFENWRNFYFYEKSGKIELKSKFVEKLYLKIEQKFYFEKRKKEKESKEKESKKNEVLFHKFINENGGIMKIVFEFLQKEFSFSNVFVMDGLFNLSTYGLTNKIMSLSIKLNTGESKINMNTGIKYEGQDKLVGFISKKDLKDINEVAYSIIEEERIKDKKDKKKIDNIFKKEKGKSFRKKLFENKDENYSEMVKDIEDILIDFPDSFVDIENKIINVISFGNNSVIWSDDIKYQLEMFNSYLNDKWEIDRVYSTRWGINQEFKFKDFIGFMKNGEKLDTLSIGLL